MKFSLEELQTLGRFLLDHSVLKMAHFPDKAWFFTHVYGLGQGAFVYRVEPTDMFTALDCDDIKSNLTLPFRSISFIEDQYTKEASVSTVLHSYNTHSECVVLFVVDKKVITATSNKDNPDKNSGYLCWTERILPSPFDTWGRVAAFRKWIYVCVACNKSNENMSSCPKCRCYYFCASHSKLVDSHAVSNMCGSPAHILKQRTIDFNRQYSTARMAKTVYRSMRKSPSKPVPIRKVLRCDKTSKKTNLNYRNNLNDILQEQQQVDIPYEQVLDEIRKTKRKHTRPSPVSR
jgi:hypothetical protein